MNRLVFIVGIILIGLTGCESAEPETPAQAIEAIIELYEARDFDALIHTRYAEISKAENDEQIQSLIDRFTTRFQDDGRLNEAITTYRSALQITPELEEGGTVARFHLNGGFIKLSRMPNGNWGFHL